MGNSSVNGILHISYHFICHLPSEKGTMTENSKIISLKVQPGNCIVTVTPIRFQSFETWKLKPLRYHPPGLLDPRPCACPELAPIAVLHQNLLGTNQKGPVVPTRLKGSTVTFGCNFGIIFIVLIHQKNNIYYIEITKSALLMVNLLDDQPVLLVVKPLVLWIGNIGYGPWWRLLRRLKHQLAAKCGF